MRIKSEQLLSARSPALRLALTLGFVALTLLMAACLGREQTIPTPQPIDPAAAKIIPEDAVAIVGGEAITAAEWRRGRAYAEAMVRLLGEPGARVDDASALESFVEDHFIVAEAERQGVSLSDAELDEEERRLLFVGARSQDDLQQILADVGLTPEEWREELKRALLASHYLEDIVLKDLAPAERAKQRVAWLREHKQALGVQILLEIAPREGLLAGDLAPDFEVAMLDGDALRLSDLRGQAVLLNFWATWCLPCQEEMPLLQRFYEENQEDGFVVLGVDVGEDAGNVRDFIDDFGVSFPIALDGPQTVTRRYRIFGMPTTFFIDRQGMIDYVATGAIKKADLDQWLDGSLGSP